MLLSTIIERELRLAARHGRTYYGRVLAGIWAIGLCLYLIFLLRVALGAAVAGAQTLAACATLGLALCLFNGVNRTCDSLSSEKREGTLGLLFLTHLKPWEIVFGKLFANGLKTVYLLIAVTPVLAIPIFLGGVSGGELLRVPLLLLNSLLLSLSIGLLVSAIVVSPRSAQSAAAGIMATLAFFLPAAAFLLGRYGQMRELALALNLLSPGYTLFMSAGSAFGLSTNYFWSALAVQSGISVCALAGACWLLPRFWKIKAARPKFREWLALMAHGDTTTRAARRSRLLGQSAIHWLNNRERFGVLGPMIFALVSFGLAVGLSRYFQLDPEQSLAVLFATLALNDFAMRIRVAQIASFRLGMDRQSGALEMILGTSLSLGDITGGIWRAIRRKLLWTYVPLLALYLVVAALYMGPVMDWHWIVVAFFLVFSVMDFVAMGYVAIWRAMQMRHPQGATGYALLRVLILPWTIWSVLMPLVVQFPFEIGGMGGLAVGVVIWAISTVRAIRSARRNLRAHFREAATDRYRFEERTGMLAQARRWSDNFLRLFLLRDRRPGVLS